MAFSHGKSTTVQVDDSAGSLTDITSYSTESSFPMETEASEVTVYGDGNKQYIPGLGDSTFSVSGRFDPTLNTLMTGVRAALIAGTVTTSSIEWGPAGNSTGAPKFTAEAILTSYEPSSSSSDPNEWSAEYQVTGAVTVGTFS